MRNSRVLSKLRAGEIVSCFKLNLGDARATEIAAYAGFDCLWTDMEHVPNDRSVIEKQVLAAKCHDVDIVVRVERGSYSDYLRPLEMDATGIMVPHIMSAADVRQVVKMTRFPPVGRRPLDGGNADGAYCDLPILEYIRQANSQRFIVLQIEDPEPLEELEAIASIEGYDVLFFGPGDFSSSIGCPAEWDHPKLIEARRRIPAAAAACGKFAGTVAGSPDELPALFDLGYQFISLGADVVGLGQYCKRTSGAFKDIVAMRQMGISPAATVKV